MKITIVSFKNDPHALAVAWGLRTIGYNPQILYFTALADHHKITLRPGFDGKSTITASNLSFPISESDTIWWRRPAGVHLPGSLHPSDRKIAEQEWGILQKSIISISGYNDCFCANPPGEFHSGSLKAFQLIIARAVGFDIPETIISNDPLEIKSFIKNNPRTIFKTSTPATWVHSDGSHAEFLTELVEWNDELADSIAACPGIYQRYVEKKFEVRSVIFGETIFSFKIDSQEDKNSLLDWRKRPEYTRGIVTPINTPEFVSDRIRGLMKELSLVTGSIDFIVTPNEEWVFLEINPSGQFLWLEYDCPSVPLLDAFCKFLISRSDDFVYNNKPHVYLHEFDKIANLVMAEEPKIHEFIHSSVVPE